MAQTSGWDCNEACFFFPWRNITLGQRKERRAVIGIFVKHECGWRHEQEACGSIFLSWRETLRGWNRVRIPSFTSSTEEKKEFLLMKYVSPGTTQSIKINQPKTQPVDQEESSTLPDLCVSSTERVRQVSLMPVFLGSLIGQCLFPYLSKSEELSI